MTAPVRAEPDRGYESSYDFKPGEVVTGVTLARGLHDDTVGTLILTTNLRGASDPVLIGDDDYVRKEFPTYDVLPNCTKGFPVLAYFAGFNRPDPVVGTIISGLGLVFEQQPFPPSPPPQPPFPPSPQPPSPDPPSPPPPSPLPPSPPSPPRRRLFRPRHPALTR